MPTEKVKVSLNTMRSARNEFLVFIRQNNYKCGLNNVSNRLRSVTNMIKKDWMVVEKSSFKTLCKKHVIQNPFKTLCKKHVIQNRLLLL